MDWNMFITDIFKIVILPLSGILVSYFVKWVNVKTTEMATNTDNQLAQKYLNILNDIVSNAVIAVNQTYVNVLKEDDAFDLEAQKKAFNKAYQYVITTLSEEGTKVLSELVGDLGEYITIQIEAEVNRGKK